MDIIMITENYESIIQKSPKLPLFFCCDHASNLIPKEYNKLGDIADRGEIARHNALLKSKNAQFLLPNCDFPNVCTKTLDDMLKLQHLSWPRKIASQNRSP